MSEMAASLSQRRSGAQLSALPAGILVTVALLGLLRFSPSFVPLTVQVYWADAMILGLAALWFLSTRLVPWSPELRLLLQLGLASLLLLTVALIGSVLLTRGAIPAADNVIQVLRFCVYGVVLIFLADLAIRTETDWGRLAHVMVVGAVAANILLVLVQLLDPPVMGSLAYMFWGEDKLRPLASGYPRVYGTFFNANWFGVFVAWVLTYAVARWSELAHRPVRLGLLVAAAVFLLAASGSRTGIISTVVGITVTLILRPGGREGGPGRRGAGMARITVVAVAAVVITGVIVAIQRLELHRLAGRFIDLWLLLMDPAATEVSTLNARVAAWTKAYSIFRGSPIFGVGGSTQSAGVSPHNGYLSMLMNFGVTGAAGLAAFVLGACVLSRRSLRHGASSRRLYGWFYGFTAAFAVAMLAGDFVYTSRLIFLWILILALVAGQASLLRSRSAGPSTPSVTK